MYENLKKYHTKIPLDIHCFRVLALKIYITMTFPDFNLNFEVLLHVAHNVDISSYGLQTQLLTPQYRRENSRPSYYI